MLDLLYPPSPIFNSLVTLPIIPTTLPYSTDIGSSAFPITDPGAHQSSPNLNGIRTAPHADACSSGWCHCLASLVLAVERFEEHCASGTRAELDSTLSSLKRALACCKSMLSCSVCLARRENAVLLVSIIQKIVAGCGQVVELYCEGRSSDVSTEWREVLLGEYEITSLAEWNQVIQALLLCQFSMVLGFLTEVKHRGSDGFMRAIQMIHLDEVGGRMGQLLGQVTTFQLH